MRCPTTCERAKVCHHVARRNLRRSQALVGDQETVGGPVFDLRDSNSRCPGPQLSAPSVKGASQRCPPRPAAYIRSRSPSLRPLDRASPLPFLLPNRTPLAGPILRLRAIAQKWDEAYKEVHFPSDPASPPAEPPPSQGQLVTAQELRRLLGYGLNATSVEWDGMPGTTLDYYQFLFCAEEFVALTRQAQPETGQRRLERVVSVSRMATQISRQVLRRQLEGGR
jgi:hypothetical protein